MVLLKNRVYSVIIIIIIIIIIETYKEGKHCHCPRHEGMGRTLEVSLHSLFNLGAKG
jgi:hypothetical protein